MQASGHPTKEQSKRGRSNSSGIWTESAYEVVVESATVPVVEAEIDADDTTSADVLEAVTLTWQHVRPTRMLAQANTDEAMAEAVADAVADVAAAPPAEAKVTGVREGTATKRQDNTIQDKMRETQTHPQRWQRR
jgi:thiazole synthase ThiGH ThiG subunit